MGIELEGTDKVVTRESLIEYWTDHATRVRAQRNGFYDNKVMCACCQTTAKRAWWFRGFNLCETCWRPVEAAKPWSRFDLSTKPVKYLAPAYAFLVPTAMEVARPLGYAVATHGSMNNDLDLIAVPWTFDAVDPIELVVAITQRTTIFYKTTDDGQYIKDSKDTHVTYLNREDYQEFPHGRVAWCIQLGNGPRIDISVMKPHRLLGRSNAIEQAL
jgi:hypothetical protein